MCTFICAPTKEQAGPTNNWMDPDEAYKMLYDIARGSYKGRTMYVIPYSMGPVGSPFAKYGIELTDSIYVVLNMAIMTRVGKDVLEALGDSDDWVRGLHCKCDIVEEKRYICHFPQDNTIISVNSGYGGNVLLGKKCFALRIASNLGRQEGWMAEHMLILGLESPDGEVNTSPPLSPPPAARPISPCSFRPSSIRRRAIRSGAWVTISPGCASVPTDACGPATRKTASSAWLPVLI